MIDPTESTLPIEPIDRTEPLEPMQRIESCDHSDHFALPIFSSQGGYQNALRTFGGKTQLDEVMESLNANVFQEDDRDTSSASKGMSLGQ